MPRSSPRQAAGGSEAVLTVINSSNATITQDLGAQMGQIDAGDTYALSAPSRTSSRRPADLPMLPLRHRRKFHRPDLPDHLG